MTSFAESILIQKLSELKTTQPSIASLSRWVLQFPQKSGSIASVWIQQLRLVNPQRKLMLLFLVNDVLQNARGWAPEFIISFIPVLLEASYHIAIEGDEECRKGLENVLNIWQERKVYNPEYIQKLKLPLENAWKFPPPAAREEASGSQKWSNQRDQESAPKGVPRSPSPQPSVLNLQLIARMLNSLQNLQQSALAKSTVKIPILPPVEAQRASFVDQFLRRREVEEVKRMEEICVLLAEQNGILAAEIYEQRLLLQMVLVYAKNQKEVLADKEKTYEENRKKFFEASQACNQLRAYLQVALLFRISQEGPLAGRPGVLCFQISQEDSLAVQIALCFLISQEEFIDWIVRVFLCFQISQEDSLDAQLALFPVFPRGLIDWETVFQQ
ncbi:regulation of nuclear pre-mRNA domain-containing protein 1B-like [Tachyglossus aculeatus]|uniref:regulation of nuclear pre-mRNA domain-containing protein 1B-like n=1 Tax=Tachyglossus aculeatus TaxID=9261 RepID=UPI0018F442D2|nr:regulation of nuclear pre-mRNA domain-containing protein 1B-like [Tachyglossus aculeatus]